MTDKDQKLRQELIETKKKLKETERELARTEKALAEMAALMALKKKSERDLGGRRGRLIPTADRLVAVEPIDEAVVAGARRRKACEVLDISVRTYERWKAGAHLDHGRKGSAAW